MNTCIRRIAKYQNIGASSILLASFQDHVKNLVWYLHVHYVTTPYLLQRCRSQNVVKMVVCSCPAVVDLNIVRPDLKFQLGFTVKDGVVSCRPEYMWLRNVHA